MTCCYQQFTLRLPQFPLHVPLIVAIFVSLTQKEIGQLGSSTTSEHETEVTEEIWVKRICEDVVCLIPQVDWEDLDRARLHVTPKVMILEGNVICLRAHLGRCGNGDGPVVVLVYDETSVIRI